MLVFLQACDRITLPTVILVEVATEPLVTMYDEAELVLDVQE